MDCVPDAPIGVADSLTLIEDASSTLIPVLANDTDVDVGDVLSVSTLTQPSTGGVVSISGTGVLFTPTANYCSITPVSFSYQAQDASGTLSSTTTGSVTITCVNDLPIVGTVALTMTGNTASGTVYSLTGTLTGSDIE